VAAQFKAAGYTPEDVRFVVLSHLHQDHIGGLAAFPRARFVVASREWQEMEQPRAEMYGYLPRHTKLPGLPEGFERTPPTFVIEGLDEMVQALLAA
jgi:N-acyl homoserine lactone hydrolase